MTAADAFRIAGQYYAAGQLAPAEHMYRYVLELEPNHGGALFALGTLSFYACNWELAIDWLRRATEAQPGRAEYWHDLGVAYTQAGYLTEAVGAIEQALLVRPNYALAANDLGQLQKEMGEIEQAIASYQDALRWQPDYADAHINLASALIEQGRNDQAVAHYREALRIQPDHVHAYYNLSQLAKEGKYSFAPSDLQQMRALVGNESLPSISGSVAAFAAGQRT